MDSNFISELLLQALPLMLSFDFFGSFETNLGICRLRLANLLTKESKILSNILLPSLGLSAFLVKHSTKFSNNLADMV